MWDEFKRTDWKIQKTERISGYVNPQKPPKHSMNRIWKTGISCVREKQQQNSNMCSGNVIETLGL